MIGSRLVPVQDADCDHLVWKVKLKEADVDPDRMSGAPCFWGTWIQCGMAGPLTSAVTQNRPLMVT